MQIPVKQFIPAILWFILILVLICMPGNSLPKMGSWFDLFSTDKLIHAFLFAGLVFLLFYPIYKNQEDAYKRKWLSRIVLFSIGWGIATELIQYFFIPMRSCDIKDIIADAAGSLVCWLWFWLKIKRLKSTT